VRVHDLVPKEVWSKRYAQIDSFEKMLAENRVTIAKFYLHISKDEQKQRFDARIDDPNKRWKISADDFKERKYWDEYTKAYEEALTQCNSDQAPWYIVPANKKWFRNLAVSQILVETLEDLKMSFPPATIDVKKLKWK
jgi:polyphosphate kinase 2 (PPK2 family)